MLCNDVLGGSEIARREEWGEHVRPRAVGTGNQGERASVRVLFCWIPATAKDIKPTTCIHDGKTSDAETHDGS